MPDKLIVILDIGKTQAKLSLWNKLGEKLERRTRSNKRVITPDYTALDAEGIENWMVVTLKEFSTFGEIDSIFSIGHGASIAIIRDDNLVLPPIDYEFPIPTNSLHEYRRLRDRFVDTGSPALPEGLNIGSQLYWIESLFPDALVGSTLIPWPQYWAWKLSGIASSEVTSLGCHTDLWLPNKQTFSNLAIDRGWAKKMAPLRKANDVLGGLTKEWVKRTGLSQDVKVYCGIHDSNAALIAARGYQEINQVEATILSTGTWFIAMKSTKGENPENISDLPESRDCLINVDVDGKPTPTARFMGGREIQLLTDIESRKEGPEEGHRESRRESRRIDRAEDQPDLIKAATSVVSDMSMILPSFTKGSGPYPNNVGRWINLPEDWRKRRAAISLYAALVTNSSLSLIDAQGCLLVEGRFAAASLFVKALASLRPKTQVFIAEKNIDVSFGAVRLIVPTLAPSTGLIRIPPLNIDLSDYQSKWRLEIQKQGNQPI